MRILNKKLTSNTKLECKTKYKRLIWNSAITNLIFYWIENNMEESVEEIASICYTSVPQLLS